MSLIQSSPDYQLSSSLRARPAKESLILAKKIARERGVSRVVNTTWLDRIGVPVFASIRPDGIKGTLCVHSGKGFSADEAEIGAYMEAIEISFGPPGRNIAPWFMASPEKIVSTFKGQIRFADFAPRKGRTVSAEDSIAAVEGTEILSGLGQVMVPAELVYIPFSGVPGVRLYGTSSNGLASGNVPDEAVVHAVAEVMERHVRSFELLDNRSCAVDIDTAPPKVRALAKRIRDVGLECHLRSSDNEFGVAYFSAYVLEPDEYDSITVAAGFGLHPISEIAAVRAIAEAVQSRLTAIHGGRDDIMKRVLLAKEIGREWELQSLRRVRDRLKQHQQILSFERVPDFKPEVRSIADARLCLFDALKRAGFNHIVVVPLSDETFPFSIVRVVVPGAEMYEPELQRVGPRLLRLIPHA